MRLGPVYTGDVVAVFFPIDTRREVQIIAGVTCNLQIRDNTVVSITLGGENMPLYRRERFLQENAPMVRVKRFVSDQNIIW